jgi:hypothetical protein
MAHSPRLKAILAAAKQRMDTDARIPEQEFWKDAEEVKKSKKRSGRRTTRA